MTDREAFECAYVATSYLLGRRDALLDGLDAPGDRARRAAALVDLPTPPERAQRLALLLLPIAAALDARGLK